jgi:hypothetical protein
MREEILEVEAGIVDHVVKSYIGNWKVKTGSKMKLFQIYELVSMWDLNNTRASPAVIAILATQKVIVMWLLLCGIMSFLGLVCLGLCLGEL